VLLNIAAVPNRAPTVNAGPDVVLQNTRETVCRPTASDPDEDVLTWSIQDETGRGIAGYPNACYGDLHPGENIITVTVDDGGVPVAVDLRPADEPLRPRSSQRIEFTFSELCGLCGLCGFYRRWNQGRRSNIHTTSPAPL
jgi:hypothetical protein